MLYLQFTKITLYILIYILHYRGSINNSNDNNDSKSSTTDQDNTQDSVLSTTSEDQDPDLIIIDFEYCAYNYRGFDLANHFIEWTIDYSNPEFPNYFHTKSQYPTQQQRYDFIKAYLKKLNESVESYVPSDSEVEVVDAEVRIFSMFSHFLWTLWSMVNVTSTIEFGYWVSVGYWKFVIVTIIIIILNILCLLAICHYAFTRI